MQTWRVSGINVWMCAWCRCVDVYVCGVPEMDEVVYCGKAPGSSVSVVGSGKDFLSEKRLGVGRHVAEVKGHHKDFYYSLVWVEESLVVRREE